jgi:hypothetical protein
MCAVIGVDDAEVVYIDTVTRTLGRFSCIGDEEEIVEVILFDFCAGGIVVVTLVVGIEVVDAVVVTVVTVVVAPCALVEGHDITSEVVYV